MAGMATATSSAGRWLGLCLIIWAVLHKVHSLPITSRPIEGNAQRLAWDEWLRLPQEQKSQEKEKKVTAKSIFTLPFRHCPPGHKWYNERCLPQLNIDPAELLKQELIYAGGGEVNTPLFTDYDYSEDGDESEELLYDPPQMPLKQTDKLPGEDQALPSEDAPLKFNIFEKKFPTGMGEAEPVEEPPETTTDPTNSTATTRAATDAGNHITQFADLQAASSNVLSTTISHMDISNIEAIVLPAGQPEATVQLVTSSLGDVKADANTSPASTTQAEADLNQLLKDDAFLPANSSSSSIDLSNHRRVAPMLTAEEMEETTTTTQEENTTEMDEEQEESTETTPTTMDEPENHLVLIKSKVQPVQLTTTTETTSEASDRFHYQHIEDVTASSSSSTTTSSSSSSSLASEESDNLMTNTIASNINLEEELRLINELVKSQQQQQETSSTLAATSTTESSNLSETTATTSTESNTETETTNTESQVADSSSSSSSSSSTAATASTNLSINTNRSNRNSKIIRIDNLDQPTTTSSSTAATTINSSSSISSDADGYTPFWWLPNIGWRLDRQVDKHGEDRSLLLRFFSTFRGNTAATFN